jgi:hypothetical protein
VQRHGTSGPQAGRFALLAVLAAGCSAVPALAPHGAATSGGNASVQDAGSSDGIFLALGDDQSGRAAIYVSAPEELATLALCVNASAGLGCDARRTVRVHRVTARDGRVLFSTDATQAVAGGMVLAVAATTKASGDALKLEAQVVEKGTPPPSGGGGAQPNLSRGKGGVKGFHEASFAASNGKSTRFKLDVPASNGDASANGLLVYLHGDGAGDYDWYWPSLAAVAKKFNLIPVAVKSPTANENGPSWWWEADANAVVLDELLKQEVRAKYNVDTYRVVFTGASGGPTFMDGPWLRYYASQYRGGAMVFCGGLVQTAQPFRDAQGFKENFPLYYYIGTADFLLDGAQSAAAYYRGKGLKVEEEHPAGVGHCQFTAQLPALMSERLNKIFPTYSAASLAVTLAGEGAWPDTVPVDASLSAMRADQVTMDADGALIAP